MFKEYNSHRNKPKNKTKQQKIKTKKQLQKVSTQERIKEKNVFRRNLLKFLESKTGCPEAF